MKISIVGCGWLGLPLAKRLVKNGHQVLGSTTSPDKLATLENAGIQAVEMKLSPMPIGKDFNILFDSELFILNIPPGRKRNPPEFYAEQIKYMRYLIDNSAIQKVIFISSTSFYPNTNDKVEVGTPYDFEKGSSKAVVWGEQEIKKIKQPLSILRCGGLMGDKRIPGKWFGGKPTAGANTPVNYIHRDEIIQVIESYIEHWPLESNQEIKNLVSPFHPTRKEVYEAMGQRYQNTPPHWIEPALTPHKVVESSFKTAGLRSPVDY